MAAHTGNPNSEIESIVATLASRQSAHPQKTRVLTGPERAAVFMASVNVIGSSNAFCRNEPIPPFRPESIFLSTPPPRDLAEK